MVMLLNEIILTNHLAHTLSAQELLAIPVAIKILLQTTEDHISGGSEEIGHRSPMWKGYLETLTELQSPSGLRDI